MMYRIDFTRLARNENEVIKHKLVTEFCEHVCGHAGHKLFSLMPDGHILDTKIVNDIEGMTGKDILQKHILSLYPEAKFSCWDCWQ